MQQLDRHTAAGSLVAGAPDLGHAAAGQPGFQAVAAQHVTRVGSAAVIGVAWVLEGTCVLCVPSSRRTLRPRDVSRRGGHVARSLQGLCQPGGLLGAER